MNLRVNSAFLLLAAVLAVTACSHGSRVGSDVGRSLNSGAATPASDEPDESSVYRGYLTRGHEVRAFRLCGTEDALWTVDTTPRLWSLLDEVAPGRGGYEEIFTIIEGRLLPPPVDGFGADYPGAIRVEQVLYMAREGWGCDAPWDAFEVRAFGNEPFWSAEVSERGLRLTRPGAQEILWHDVQVETSEEETRYSAVDDDAGEVELRIRSKPTRDTMADAYYGLSATVRFSGGTWSGGAIPGGQRTESEGSAPRGSAAPSLQELRNATYTGLSSLEEPVTLADGRWQGAPYVEGGASRPAVDFVRDLRILGDLDGDGREEAVVLLEESMGGSGHLLHVAVVARRNGGVENTATVLVGDRVQVRAARIQDRRIELELVQTGPGDAACCPGEVVTRLWSLTPEASLEESPGPSEPHRLSMQTISGTEWVLRAWDWDEPAPLEPEVTLVVRDGTFAGSSGCNRYSAAAETGDSPGELRIGPAMGTRRACPEPEMSVEDRFLARLASVTRFGFLATRLALSYEEDGHFGVLLFEGREPRPEGER